MNKYLIIVFAVFISGNLGAQTHSDSANAAYQKYLERQTYDIILAAFTDTIVIEEEAIFTDYSLNEITDTSVTIDLKRNKQIVVSREGYGWVLRGYRKNKKDGLWVFCQANGFLIERWQRGVIKSRRWLLDSVE